MREEGNNTIELIVRNTSIFSNYLGFKKYLDRIPQGKHVIMDFAGIKMIDHSFMQHLHRFEHDYIYNGGTVKIRGLERHKPVSAHPMVARRVSKVSFIDVPITYRQVLIKKVAIEENLTFEPEKNSQ